MRLLGTESFFLFVCLFACFVLFLFFCFFCPPFSMSLLYDKNMFYIAIFYTYISFLRNNRMLEKRPLLRYLLEGVITETVTVTNVR